jgi:4,5-DOPA dioxygenase extradiol
MNRKEFLSILGGMTAMSGISEFNAFTNSLKKEDDKMPVLFVGHGSPMNAIEDNEFTLRWRQMGKDIPTPKAILVISAHWLTRGTRITAMNNPQTIHDFGGFPQELFDVQYPAPGDAKLAAETASLFTSTGVELDHDWGLDHGAWSVTKQMFPKADIPVLQLSIDYNKSPEYHYNLAKQLSALRNKGVLILASGNMVHNLKIMRLPQGDFNRINEAYGFDWTLEMNDLFKKKIQEHDHQSLINYEGLHSAAKLAVPTPDHYYPLLYAMALQDQNESTMIFNDKAVAGSLTMTSVKIG